MTIQYFNKFIDGEIAANAVPGPKNVTFEAGQHVVRTGADYVAPPVDKSAVTRAQFLKALQRAGLLTGFNTLVGSGTSDLQIDWNNAAIISPTDPFIEQIRVAAGKTQAQVDAIFAAARLL
jgi:hypothetical protein